MKDHQSLVNHYRSLKASIGVFRSDSSSILTGAYIYSKGRLKKERFSPNGGAAKTKIGVVKTIVGLVKTTIHLTKQQSI